MKLRKDVKQFIQQAELDGWKIVGETGSGHIKLHHPSGATVIMPKTPSDHRSLKNTRSTMRNAVKLAEQNPRGYRR